MAGADKSPDWPTVKHKLRECFHEPPLIVFGTGPSCAVDKRFGMEALARHLDLEIPNLLVAANQKAEWNAVVTNLNTGMDLETALTRDLSRETVAAVTQQTAIFVEGVDRENSGRFAKGETAWPLTALFQRLVGKFPNTPVLHAITPNYDLLMEYACDAAGIEYTSGFVGGVSRRRDWMRAGLAMSECKKRPRGKKIKTDCVPRPHIRLYKVHGSLNLFVYNGEVVENNVWLRDPPPDFERVMIIPGRSKYEQVLAWREDLLKTADEAITDAAWFMFVGYGMNDSHLESQIRRKLTNGAVSGIIVTLASNNRIEGLLKDAPKLWLVCGYRKETDEGTRIMNRDVGEVFLTGRQLWDISRFCQEIIGA